MKQKLSQKIGIFTFITIVIICSTIFYGFLHQASKSVIIYFTYQSNYLVWTYYFLWTFSFILMKYFHKRSPFRIMEHYGWNQFIGTIITFTGLMAVFVLGPFELIYNWVRDYSFGVSSDNITFENAYIVLNSFMFHVVIPSLVVYDLAFTTYYDVDKMDKKYVLIGIGYLILYLISIEIFGSISGVYPYTPLNPNAFLNDKFGLAIAIVSPFIGVACYSLLSNIWFRNLVSKNGGELFH